MIFKKNKINVLIGFGGHSKVVLEVLNIHNINITHVLTKETISSSNKFNFINSLEEFRDVTDPISFYFGIGDLSLRKRIFQNIISQINHPEFPSFIHPSATVYSTARIGSGTQVMAHAIIGPNSIIKDYSIINHGSIVDHDTNIGNFVNICPNVTIGGNAYVGNEVFIGMGASISNNVRICDYSTIGAQTFLNKDILEPQKFLGNNI